ncbi:MAG: hypothetical protein CFE31_10750 [Rhizobiales bacterium PAR1]|nr:MAG: hypothetical protein CFE31_10750 [Rhizobiales bacterium PAR1]
MRLSSLKAPLLRDLIVPLLCAVLALGGLASVRASGSKTLLALGGSHFELCLPSGDSGSGDDVTHHDCDACCLPMPTGLGRPPEPVSVQATLGVQIHFPSHLGQQEHPSFNLPWSRGPPAFG